MKKIIALTNVFLKSSFSNYNSKMGIQTGSKKKLPKVLYFMLILYLIAIFAFLSYNLIDGFIKIHQEKVFIGMILLGIIGFAAFQSIFSSINSLYFTKDSEFILPLPLKPYQIISARTIVLILLEYIIEFFIGFVPLVMYGYQTGSGILYYITMLIALILIPILPILLVSTVIMIIMSFARFAKNKNRFQIIATILALILIMAISLASGSISGEMTNEQMAQMLMKANGMLELIKGYFPSLDFLVNALTSENIFVVAIEIIKTFLITAVAFGIYLFIANKIYLKGLVGNLFSGNSRKTKIRLKENDYKNSKLYKTYIGKEFKILARNPVFLMQCLAPAIFIPIIMIGIVYLQTNSIQKEGFQLLFSVINVNSIQIASIVLGIIEFFTMFIYISITAISRDGSNAVFIKYIPVSLYKQYIYKIVPNMIMSLFSIVITLIIAQIILKFNISVLIAIFAVSSLMSLFQSMLMIIIDLKRPKLEWDSEYAVVKQNFNLIFPAIVGLINIGILVLISILFKNLNIYIGLGSLIIIFSLAACFTNIYLYKNQRELANKIL